MDKLTRRQTRAAATVLGAILASPACIYGFLIGGSFFGVISGGILAIPGAFLGALSVLAFGAALGRLALKFGRLLWNSKAVTQVRKTKS